MKYMGSKSRIAGQIVPILQAAIDRSGTEAYIEPFCGGCNVIDKIICERRVASDVSAQLIALLRHVQEGHDLPLTVDRPTYNSVRSRPEDYPAWYVGAVGYLASYNGRYFDGGYAGIVRTKAGTIRDYYDEARRNLLGQNLAGIEFSCADYGTLGTRGAVIYCDPPYMGVKQYGVSAGLDHEAFWDTVRRWSRDNLVFVSEHTAPPDFKCVWEQSVTRTIDNTKRVKAVERLFVSDHKSSNPPPMR